MDRPAQRQTRQKTAVAEVVGGSDAFCTAQQIHDELRARGDKVSLTTVYRTLQAMADAGEVDVLRTPEGEQSYRRCRTEEHHHHLVCRSCGRTVEIEGEVVERWLAGVGQDHGFRDVGHDLEFFGLCSDC